MKFDFRGFFYQKGIGDIRAAYQATMAALQLLLRDAELEAEQIDREIKGGTRPSHIYDDDGLSMYSETQYAIHRLESIQSSIDMSRQAYMLILYHHWEKHCVTWMKSHHYNQDNAFDWAANNSVPFDRYSIDLLRNVNNYTKHNRKVLFDIHPELFVFNRYSDGTIGDSRLVLTAEFVDEMFAAIARSGHQMVSPQVGET